MNMVLYCAIFFLGSCIFGGFAMLAAAIKYAVEADKNIKVNWNPTVNIENRRRPGAE
jgi:hypothetical protein